MSTSAYPLLDGAARGLPLTRLLLLRLRLPFVLNHFSSLNLRGLLDAQGPGRRKSAEETMGLRLKRAALAEYCRDYGIGQVALSQLWDNAALAYYLTEPPQRLASLF